MTDNQNAPLTSDQIRRETGIDTIDSPLTVAQWVRWLRDHQDSRVQAIGDGLAYGYGTGRIGLRNYDGFALDPQTYQVQTNGEFFALIAQAFETMTEATTAAGFRAFHTALFAYLG
jgi:hypothetical protein